MTTPSILALLAVSLTAGLAAAQDNFRFRQVRGATNCAASCAADFNNDGKADFVTVNGGYAAFTVYLGQTGTVPVVLGTTAMNNSGEATAVCAADFNNDGKIDIAITNRLANNVEIWLNTGGGHFTHSVDKAVGANPRRIVTGKLNNADNFADLAVLCDNDVWVLLGNGSGGVLSTTTTHISAGGANLSDMVIGKLNTDAVLDLAVADTINNNIWLGTNNGLGSFTQTQLLALAPGSLTNTIALGDLNSDGKNDLAVCNSGTYMLEIYTGLGNGHVNVAPAASINDGTFSVAWKMQLEDYNLDGKLDIGVGYNNEVEPHLYLQDAGFQFGNTQIFLPAGPANFGFSFADFNGDGIKDIMSASNGSAGITLVPGIGGGKYLDYDTSVYASPVTTSAVIADFDGEGHADVVTCDEFHRMLMSYNYNNNGGFNFLGDAEDNDGDPYHIEAGDFNSDGRPDIVTANAGNDTVALMLNKNDGSGAFFPPTHTPVQSAPKYLAVGDVNLDGFIDVVATNSGSGTASVLLGNGAGGFVTGQTIGGYSEPIGCSLVDFDYDGYTDLVVADHGADQVDVRFGGMVGFGISPLQVSTDSGPYAVDVADFDGDGYVDIVTACEWGGSVGILFGQGAQAVGYTNFYYCGEQPTSVRAGDVNGDGKPDVVVAHHAINWRNMGIFTNDGTGALNPMETYAMMTRQSFNKMEVLIGDLNGDGQNDIITSAGLFGPAFLNHRLQPTGVLFFDGGTGWCRGVVGHSMTDTPYINATPDLGFTTTGAPARSLGLGIVTDAANPFFGSDYLGIGIILDIDLFNASQVYTLDLVTDWRGDGFYSLPLPNDPGLVGQSFFLQSVWASPAASPCRPSIYGLASSALLRIDIQF